MQLKERKPKEESDERKRHCGPHWWASNKDLHANKLGLGRKHIKITMHACLCQENWGLWCIVVSLGLICRLTLRMYLPTVSPYSSPLDQMIFLFPLLFFFWFLILFKHQTLTKNFYKKKKKRSCFGTTPIWSLVTFSLKIVTFS